MSVDAESLDENKAPTPGPIIKANENAIPTSAYFEYNEKIYKLDLSKLFSIK